MQFGVMVLVGKRHCVWWFQLKLLVRQSSHPTVLSGMEKFQADVVSILSRGSGKGDNESH
ncbi:hypothetical protein QUB56_01960 [Microcoleus sp. AR_TQ3_B6]|uniref:hypothetical protein n=1 Tax=Microcoleus sp. AR_TQ3_B6 TaxID=3055284 RepID=UPI002FD6E40F